eukprot:13904951-Ditylum_brightwellii.AAC.1
MGPPLASACRMEMILGTLDRILNNMRVICFEWTAGINPREWIQSQQNCLNFSVPAESLTYHIDNGIEDRNRCHLMSSMSLVCHITKALADNHEVGVVLNNLIVEHIIVNETRCNEDNCDNDSCMTIHIISLGSVSIICGKTNFFSANEANDGGPSAK